MSFGFSVGDFIGVGELAHRLYRDVYLVARSAPEELQMLNSELGTLTLSIDLLLGERKNADSTLVKAGESRIRMVDDILKLANATLKDLELVASK